MKKTQERELMRQTCYKLLALADLLGRMQMDEPVDGTTVKFAGEVLADYVNVGLLDALDRLQDAERG